MAAWNRRPPRLAPKGAPLDSFHAILFYASSAVAVGAGLAAALVPGRGRRGLAVAGLGIGLAGLYASLSAGFVALVALLSLLAMAALLASPAYRRL
ncbi:MAG TPA: hypothetical protein VK131_12815, partial [Candidatus Acidoferrales bacterium]|nr:hypothetical protein [Candidatus Acidoferrales bacterium]